MLSSALAIKQKQYSVIFPRRKSLNNISGRIHLHGAPKSGKSAIAIEYAKRFNNPFYIDCLDLRNTESLIKSTLLKISMEKKIDLLIIDNITNDFILPQNIPNIITISECATQRENFINKEILPLSFEEFVSFDSSNQNINQLFGSFIKYGNLAQMPFMKEYLRETLKQDIARLIFGRKLEIAKNIISFQGKIISINQIYLITKKHLKTSKDSMYKIMDDLCGRGILYAISEFNNTNATKKIFLFDFSLSSVFSYDKNFVTIFENAVFLELLQYNKEIFYSTKVNLICNDIGYIISPFGTLESIKHRLKTLDSGLKLSKIVVITMDLEDEFIFDKMQVIIKSFISFALDYSLEC